jgi:hypothetical protein
MSKPKSHPKHSDWGSVPSSRKPRQPPRHGLDPSTWKSLDTPGDFIEFALEVMVPVVARDNPGIAVGFRNEVMNLSVKGNKRNMLVDLFSYVEEYLCSYLETRGDSATLDKIREADQYMRGMIVVE